MLRQYKRESHWNLLMIYIHDVKPKGLPPTATRAKGNEVKGRIHHSQTVIYKILQSAIISHRLFSIWKINVMDSTFRFFFQNLKNVKYILIYILEIIFEGKSSKRVKPIMGHHFCLLSLLAICYGFGDINGLIILRLYF